MSLETRLSKETFTGNGVTTVFPFSFKVWKSDQVAVYVGSSYESTDVTSSCSVEISGGPGGTVTFPVAPDVGATVVVCRKMPFTQEDRYVSGTRFDPHEIEDRLDQDCAERQELREAIERCVKSPVTSDKTPGEIFDEITHKVNAAVDDVKKIKEDITQIEEGNLSQYHAVSSESGDSKTLADWCAEIDSIKDTLSNRKIIYVDDYISEDEADNTAGIQAALSATTNAHIVFSKRVYNISDTLWVSCQGGGPYLDLGECTIKWIGETAKDDYSQEKGAYSSSPIGSTLSSGRLAGALKSIEDFGWAYYGKPMLDIKPNEYYDGNQMGGRCVVEGGIFYGQHKASIGIRISGFAPLVHGTRIYGVKHCGIALVSMTSYSSASKPYGVRDEDWNSSAGTVRLYDPGFAQSGGAQISDCYIVQQGKPGWSGGRIEQGLSPDVGIYFQSLDNKVDNCIVNWFDYGMVFRSSGNQITNTHITETPTTKADVDGKKYMSDYAGNFLSDIPDIANVVVYSDDGTSCISGVNILSNMYFNYGKYVVLGKYGSYLGTDIIGGMYLLKSSACRARGKSFVNTYLYYSESYRQVVHASAFEAFHPSFVTFNDYVCGTSVTGASNDVSIDVFRSTYPRGGKMIQARHLVSQRSHDPVLLTSSSFGIPYQKYVVVGCIMTKHPASGTYSDYGFLEYTYSNKGAFVTGSIYYDKDTSLWKLGGKDSYGVALSATKLVLGQTAHSVILDGCQFTSYWLYYGSSNTYSITTDSYLNMRSVDGKMNVYLFGTQESGDMTYVTTLSANALHLI